MRNPGLKTGNLGGRGNLCPGRGNPSPADRPGRGDFATVPVLQVKK